MRTNASAEKLKKKVILGARRAEKGIMMKNQRRPTAMGRSVEE